LLGPEGQPYPPAKELANGSTIIFYTQAVSSVFSAVNEIAYVMERQQ
jgi:hypothetical protein